MIKCAVEVDNNIFLIHLVYTLLKWQHCEQSLVYGRSPLVTVREWKIENYEVKYFLKLLCLNDSRKRNNGVSSSLNIFLHLFQYISSATMSANLRKFGFTDTLLFLGRGCILPMRRDILVFLRRTPALPFELFLVVNK